MKKKEFIEELRKNLFGLAKEDIEEIVDDYNEHFIVGKKKKRTEAEIAKSLGDPKEIARDVKKELIGNRSPIRDELDKVCISFREFIKGAGEALRGAFEKDKPKENEKPKKKITNVWVLLALIFVNLVIVFPVWISLFSSLFSILATGAALSISGIAIFLGGIFTLSMPFTGNLSNLFLSGTFAGIGISALGIIMAILSVLVFVLFFRLTKFYLIWIKNLMVGEKR